MSQDTFGMSQITLNVTHVAASKHEKRGRMVRGQKRDTFQLPS